MFRRAPSTPLLTGVDVISSVIVAAAAGLLLWTQVEQRWLKPAEQPKSQDVTGLTIPANKVRHTRGTGTVALVEFTDYQCPYCKGTRAIPFH